MSDEPMAILHWDFVSRGMNVRIKGQTEIRTASMAAKIRDIANGNFGDGSHWVETLNWSYAERYEHSPSELERKE